MIESRNVSIFYRNEGILGLLGRYSEMASDAEITYQPVMHKVNSATTPNDIAELVIKDDPSLVLLGVNFNARGGLYERSEGLGALVRTLQRIDVPIVMLTTLGDGYAAEAFAYGAVGYVGNILDYGHIVDTVRRYAR
jgi:PleD family two-component response regulator|tara:strand:+ start:569 stop:979 length:411 start_codon:yes stop_codon:yes gene_type:complete